MKLLSFLYKSLRTANDVKAVAKGKVARRAGRRVAGKLSGRLFRKLFR